MLASGPRAEGLHVLEVPTLVIHGLDDTLIQPDGGERTAELVPGARLLLVEDMGHDRPEPLWPLLAEAILLHTQGGGPMDPLSHELQGGSSGGPSDLPNKAAAGDSVR